jgi:hypothetical protein
MNIQKLVKKLKKTFYKFTFTSSRSNNLGKVELTGTSYEPFCLLKFEGVYLHEGSQITSKATQSLGIKVREHNVLHTYVELRFWEAGDVNWRILKIQILKHICEKHGLHFLLVQFESGSIIKHELIVQIQALTKVRVTYGEGFKLQAVR